MTKKVDFIIVGQGLAGSVLALELQQRNQKIVLFGNSQQPSASAVAGGLYNPLTGRKMVRTWLADELFPTLERFYQGAEQRLGARFLHPMPMVRPFATARGATDWRLQREEQWWAEVVPSPRCSRHQHGALLLRQTGHLDVGAFLDATRAHLRQRGGYEEATFAYDGLQLGEEGVRYGDWMAGRLIFCEGAYALNNPFFGQLPFRIVKGELLEVALQTPLEFIYNSSVFVLPQPGYRAWVGATYDWQDRSWGTTAAARAALEERLQRSFYGSYEVTGQRAGLRPATFDRRPFVGLHPQHPRLGIFNGLGSKGVSLAPYWAQVFANHLLRGTPLPRPVRAGRNWPIMKPD